MGKFLVVRRYFEILVVFGAQTQNKFLKSYTISQSIAKFLIFYVVSYVKIGAPLLPEKLIKYEKISIRLALYFQLMNFFGLPKM